MLVLRYVRMYTAWYNFFSTRGTMQYSRTSYVRRASYIQYTYLYILCTLVLDLRTSKMRLNGVLCRWYQGNTVLQQWRYCIRHYRGLNWTRTSSSTSTVHLTAATYHGHLVDTVSLRTAWERRVSLPGGGVRWGGWGRYVYDIGALYRATYTTWTWWCNAYIILEYQGTHFLQKILYA